MKKEKTRSLKRVENYNHFHFIKGQPNWSYSLISPHLMPPQTEMQLRSEKCPSSEAIVFFAWYFLKSSQIPFPTTAIHLRRKVAMVRGTNSEDREGRNIWTQKHCWEKHQVKPPRWNNSARLLASWLRFNPPEVQRPRFHLFLPNSKYRLTPLISVKLLQIFTAANWSNVCILCLTPSLRGEKLLKASLQLNSSSVMLGWTHKDKILFFASRADVCSRRSNQIRTQPTGEEKMLKYWGGKREQGAERSSTQSPVSQRVFADRSSSTCPSRGLWGLTTSGCPHLHRNAAKITVRSPLEPCVVASCVSSPSHLSQVPSSSTLAYRCWKLSGGISLLRITTHHEGNF